MESMYEYDPQRKQYRRRGGDAASAAGQSAPGQPKGGGDIYDTRSGQGKASIWGSRRSVLSGRPLHSTGKRLFWIAFIVVALGWMTLTVILSRQHQKSGEPLSIRSLFFGGDPPPLLEDSGP